LQYFSEYFIRYIQYADAAMVLAIKFIALLVHWTQWTPSDQLLGSIPPIQTCWIILLSAFTKQGPPLLTAIESELAALFSFSYSMASTIPSRLGKSIIIIFSQRLFVCMWLFFGALV
jgi:hypothetical protein